MPARAQEESRQSAPVQEQQRLLVAVEGVPERLDQRAREQLARAAHVDDLDLREFVDGPELRRAVRLPHGPQPARQVDALDLSVGGPVPALGVRGGGAEDDGRAGQLAQALGDRARVVARRGVVLLVGPLVRLVDHDQAEVRLRREDGGARADDDVERTGGDLRPLVVRLPEREPRVQHTDATREALGEATHGLRRERNLGHQHDPTPPEADRVRERVEVDLGLAAARHAVQQQRAAVGAVDRIPDGGSGGPLFVQ